MSRAYEHVMFLVNTRDVNEYSNIHSIDRIFEY